MANQKFCIRTTGKNLVKDIKFVVNFVEKEIKKLGVTTHKSDTSNL